MKRVFLIAGLVVASFTAASVALSLDGQVRIHDPSTIMLCNGEFYT